MSKPNKRIQRSVDGNVSVVSQNSPGGMRKMRSPLGHQLAVSTVNSKGQKVLQTPDGRQFISRKF